MSPLSRERFGLFLFREVLAGKCVRKNVMTHIPQFAFAFLANTQEEMKDGSPHSLVTDKQRNTAFLRSELLLQHTANAASNGRVIVRENHNRIARIQVEIKMSADAKGDPTVTDDPLSIDHQLLPSVSIPDARMVRPLDFPGENQCSRRGFQKTM